MKLNVQEHLKYWLWRLASLLWAEHKFDISDDTRAGLPSISTTDENIEENDFG